MAYQVSQAKYDERKRCKDDNGTVSSKTMRQYKRHTIGFAQWCKEEHGVKEFADCKQYIQEYADWLVREGKSDGTCHTYLAAICRYFDIPLDKIKKPKRICANNKRSRGEKESDSRADTRREISPRLYDFAEKVGVRRAEYARISDTDLVCDESGHPCVCIDKGKGGKFQLQRILPEGLDAITKYFQGTGCVLFAKEELTNKIDLHALRAVLARRAYDHYVERIEREGRDKLIAEIKARWEKYCGKKWDESVVRDQPYYIRGANKHLAIENGLPVVYNRLALMAVSVFHLSHWRLDVTVGNYILAVN